jgi:hypothetical protein
MFSRDDDDDNGDDLPTGHVDLIDMMGFLEWSVSTSATRALFAGMPANPQGRRYAEAQMPEHFLRMTLKRMGFLSSNKDSDED